MSTITVTEEEPHDQHASTDDAAFAHGAAVGRFESHMESCGQRHTVTEYALSDISRRLADVESTARLAAVQASNAQAEAVVAEGVALDAVVASTDEPVDEPDDTVTELEMPEVDSPSEEPEHPKKGFSLW